MNSIDSLCAVLASREKNVRAAAFGGREQLSFWISSGVLVPVGSVETIMCTECDAPHMVDVETFSSRSGWYCAQVGFVEPEPHIVTAFAVRSQTLAEQLRLALGLKKAANPWPTDVPILWTLGDFELGEYIVAACWVPNAGDLTVFNELTRFLRTPRGHPDATAVLTNDDRDLDAVMLPDGAQIVKLIDVLALVDEDYLSIDRDVLARHVLPGRLLRPPGRGRPPIKREEICEILSALDREHKLDGLSDRAQHKLAVVQLQIRHGEKSRVAWATFRDALRNYRSRRT